jgi:predicted acylesterase/phospholipase RssA
MANSNGEEAGEPKKVVVGCQGGGVHAAFAVGVLTEILGNVDRQEKQKDEGQKFELVGVSGTSAGALCALMTWYGLAPKNGKPRLAAGSDQDAQRLLVGLPRQNMRRGRAERPDIPYILAGAERDPGAWRK